MSSRVLDGVIKDYVFPLTVGESQLNIMTGNLEKPSSCMKKSGE